MNNSVSNLIKDVDLSFKLLEFSIRVMIYAEQEKIDPQIFGPEIQLNLPEENIVYDGSEFQNNEDILRSSQMNVGAAFGATAISLDCLRDNLDKKNEEIDTTSKLVQAVRNAFSHSIASPKWYVKSHNIEILNLNFLNGPEVDLGKLNGTDFEYQHIGDMAVWDRIKDFLINSLPQNNDSTF